MRIPDNCQFWRTQMKKEAKPARVVSNIEKEKCIPPGIEQEFFKQIAGKDNYGSPEDAWMAANKIIWEASDDFQYKGKDVADEKFHQLLHLQRLGDLKDMVPKEEWKKLMITLGPKNNDLEDFPLSDADVLKSILRRLKQVVSRCSLGLKKTDDSVTYLVVWITDYDNAEVKQSMDKGKELFERLGASPGPRWAIVYTRSEVQTLKVPTVFDAINLPRFRPVQNCKAPSGTTHPVSRGGLSGLPEAIHHGCEVKITDFMVVGV